MSMRMGLRLLLQVLGVASVLVLAGCRGTDPTAARDFEDQAKWHPYVSGHTTGVISRRSPIRIRFTTDIAPESASPAQLNRLVFVDPATRGKVAFVNARELVFTPDAELRPGAEYRVRLSPRGLRGVPRDLSAYEFSFRVHTREFDVSVQGLEAQPGSDGSMILRGRLNTADAEDPAQIEQVVVVSLGGKQSLLLRWTHSDDGLVHQFTAADLRRASYPQNVVVKWNGRPIGSARTGEQVVVLPARNQFVLTRAIAFEEQGSRHIRLQFSDNLDPGQNLVGLIELSSGRFTASIEGNTILIYPEAPPRGEISLRIDSGLRNARGDRLSTGVNRTLVFEGTKPQVRFAGKGVILPDGDKLMVPFEVVNARSVQVTALRVYDENMSQFLQVNKLDGDREMGRVGRYLWRRTIALTGPVTDSWTRYSLDVTELMRSHPGGMFHLVLHLTPADAVADCSESDLAAARAHFAGAPANQEDGDRMQRSWWDFYEEYWGAGQVDWNRRFDPCNAAYYVYGNQVRATRNLIASNIGLLAKRDSRGRLLVTATDLRTARPLPGTRLTVQNYQGQPLATATTDANGFAQLEVDGTPFLLIGEANDQRSYLKLNAGNALPISHFDTGGESVTRGVKGFLYGDRGVWRPGDTIHLVLVIQDKDGSLPPNHPVTLELRDPRGQLVQTYANSTPTNGFYRFDLATEPDAPTGDWTAKAMLGDLSFSKRLKVETVMPNRLKIALDVGEETLGSTQPLEASLSAQWLSGATAAGLRADVQVSLSPAPTRFSSFTDYVFDDPAREFATLRETVFEGTLDSNGEARFTKQLAAGATAPGMLSATFTTRVFERGGGFSISRTNATYAPFDTFVGLKLPKGDVARGMLLTDTDHTVEIAAVSSDGRPAAARKLQVTLYKADWKWWWDKTSDSLARFVQADSNRSVKQDLVETGKDGMTWWTLRVNFPEWGRYLVRVCDTEGGHCAGRTFYIDWPSWAGKEREHSGPAANVLAITSDKASYVVGETATIQLPEAAQGRALITIENASEILEARWLEPKQGNTRFTVPITRAMAPNVYVAVTLVQPHEGKSNDRPIRLYGVIPLIVSDPQTRLTPVLRAAEEWKPESRASVEIAEAQGRAMTYTVAVVDEGLLSLTSFKTPDPHEHFYAREALGISTWDLFDDVVGAYGAELERLLALGGSDSTVQIHPEEKRSRFPPVVRFLGPFRLQAGGKATHEIDVPRYVGAVRVMVVAGEKGAYGAAQKSVFVRQPLMLLPTMPRVIGPGEEVAVPVSVFVSEPAIRSVSLSIEPDAMFTTVGAGTTQIAFARPEEKLGVLRLKAADRLGPGRVRFVASSGSHRAIDEIAIEVRSANPATTRLETRALQPGETWRTKIVPHGLPGTHTAVLEISGMPAIDLERRLGYLIHYPHGCLEQTTSGAFPQLYLPALMKLEEGRKLQIEAHIRSAIERLRWHQLADGGFSTWPTGSGGFPSPYAIWSTIYATHFLIEAERAGYALPPTMRENALRKSRFVAQQWSEGRTLEQAYRLYVLALAGEPEVGAMNRLRERLDQRSLARWLLAASYKRAGLDELAGTLATGDPLQIIDENHQTLRADDYTMGSVLRDRALILHSLVTLGRFEHVPELMRGIAAELSSRNWYSTQSVGFALMAIANAAKGGEAYKYDFEHDVGGSMVKVHAETPLVQVPIPEPDQAERALTIRNTSERVLFVTTSVRGIPKAGEEDEQSSDLALQVTYTDDEGRVIDRPDKVPQGTDLIVKVDVRNDSKLRIDNIALTQIFPAGWEIHNERLDGSATESERRDAPSVPSWDGSRDATQPLLEYTDIRDDRVMRYFALRPGESIRFTTRVNAAYLGRFYLPSVLVEAMYDASKSARTRGQWTEVVSPVH
jgi:uncharacterized protein YfaS (alpha-2-macroglobulin family)